MDTSIEFVCYEKLDDGDIIAILKFDNNMNHGGSGRWNKSSL